jgi:hypothetical protein
MNNSPQPTKRTQAQQDSIKTALSVIRGLDELAGNEHFRLFMKRFSDRADELAMDILHNDKITPEDREKTRNRRLGILDVLLSPSQDRAAQISVLASFGIDP